MHRKPQLSDFEGLIFSTAVRYAPVLADEDVEDIKQILRVKVWQALQAFDRTRSTQDVEAFVFGCVCNRVKDMLKAQERRNDARNGRQLYIEDQEERGAFEAEYLRVEEDVAFAVVEAQRLELPSTLTRFERQVVVLLVAGYNQTEVSRQLAVTRKRVLAARVAVQGKMLDWKPGSYTAEEMPTPIAA